MSRVSYRRVCHISHVSYRCVRPTSGVGLEVEGVKGLMLIFEVDGVMRLVFVTVESLARPAGAGSRRGAKGGLFVAPSDSTWWMPHVDSVVSVGVERAPFS